MHAHTAFKHTALWEPSAFPGLPAAAAPGRRERGVFVWERWHHAASRPRHRLPFCALLPAAQRLLPPPVRLPARPSRASVRASLAQEAGSALYRPRLRSRREGGGGKAGGGGGGGGTTPGRSWRRARWESSGYPAGLAGGLCPHLGAAAPRLSRPWLRVCGRRHRGAGGTLDCWYVARGPPLLLQPFVLQRLAAVMGGVRA